MPLSVREGHRLWAESYDTGPNPLIALETRTMSTLLASYRATRIIDVACGTGQWLLRLRQTGANVAGVDLCSAMLERAASHEALSRRLIRGDVARLPFRDRVADLVLCSLALGYFPDLRQSFSELARICAVNGRVAVSDVHPKALAAGWTRSFRANGTTHEIDHFVYQEDRIQNAAFSAGLNLVSWHAAYIGEPERPLFQLAGKEHLFTHASGIPALFAGVWERLC
jgi:ubiquinone/menaquinone biosynthesis C-methylase UbiE